jgi:hypothetical protein
MFKAIGKYIVKYFYFGKYHVKSKRDLVFRRRVETRIPRKYYLKQKSRKFMGWCLKSRQIKGIMKKNFEKPFSKKKFFPKKYLNLNFNKRQK